MELHHSIGRNISVLYRSTHIFLTRHLEKYGISSGQFPFIIGLYRQSGISQELLSEYLMIDKATTAKAVCKLVEDGFIEKRVKQSDKRACELYLTGKGEKLVPVIFQVLDLWGSIIYRDFSDTDKELLKDLLNKIVNNITENREEKP